jgi:hypothetical protein
MRSSLYGGLAVAAILIVGLVLVACGSSNDNSTTTALSKAAFLKQGNAICKKGNQQINQAAHKQFPKGSKPTKADFTKFTTDTAIPNVQTQIDGIKALGAPTGDEAKVNAITAAAQAGLDKTKKDPSLFTSNKGDPFAQANKLATAYGLTVCGSGGG